MTINEIFGNTGRIGSDRDARLFRVAQRSRHQAQLMAWSLRGRIPPPPILYKRKLLRRTIRAINAQAFVETGTYHGDTVRFLIDSVDSLYSIELGPDLYAAAFSRFEQAPNVKVVQGDSRVQIANVASLTSALRTTYWLDGHASEGITATAESRTPVVDEIATVLDVQVARAVVLIDDARSFGSEPDYPTLEEFGQLVKERRAEAILSVEHDVIRVEIPSRR
jgi:hypothetical protein